MFNQGQFHQHFMSSFCANIFTPKNYKANISALLFLAPKFCTKNALVKRWWNWHLLTLQIRVVMINLGTIFLMRLGYPHFTKILAFLRSHKCKINKKWIVNKTFVRNQVKMHSQDKIVLVYQMNFFDIFWVIQILRDTFFGPFLIPVWHFIL